MKIGAWQEERTAGRVRLSMRVQWEDRARDDATIWFEWPEALAHQITADANVALLAAYPLAMSTGEQRLKLEGAVPPRLADGVRAAMALAVERTPALRPVRLEVLERGTAAAAKPAQREAALCLSGGVDALAALQENLEALPPDHPARFRRGLFVFGLNSFDFVDGREVPARARIYELHAARLTQFSSTLGIALMRATTNLRSLYPDFQTWASVMSNTPLTAIGHAMRTHLSGLAIASTGLGINTIEALLHPFVDPLFATHDFDVHPVQQMLTRAEKVRRLAAWPEGLAVLRVCFLIELPTGLQLNCGRCEKCVRTMLELLAAGGDALTLAPFPADDVTADQIDRLPFKSRNVVSHYVELMAPLSALGRNDLVAAIRRGLRRAETCGTSRPSGWRNLRGR
jgi:hypothetical protein